MKLVSNKFLVLGVAATLGVVSNVVQAEACDKTTMETTTITSPLPVVTVDKPIILHDTTKIIERSVVTETTSSSGSRRATMRSRAKAKASVRRSAARMASAKSQVKTIERIVEKPIIVEKPVIVERAVEKPVYINHVVEKPIYIERQVQQPVMIEKTQPVIIEKKEGRHLLNLKLF